MKTAPVQHAAEYTVFLLLAATVRALPHPAARALGGALGGVAHALDGRHRRVALRNLEIAFPELSLAARRATVRACYRHFGATLLDVVSGQRFEPVGFCRRLDLEGWEHWHTAKRAGRGILVMGSHVGNWEVIPSAIALYGGDFHVVGRRLDNPWLERHAQAVRERFGNHTIEKHGAARPMLRALHRGANVGLLIDQRVRGDEGIRVPFFGRPTITSPILARLSLRTGAPVLPVFGTSEPGGRWRVTLCEPIVPPADSPGREDADETVAALTAQYLAVVEREIRKRPAQWLWLHDRWRER